MIRNRTLYAGSFCGGSGLEIGALHFPFPIPAGSRVRYVDRMSVAGLRKQYPELAAMPLVEPDILDNGETLETIPDGREDFVIASQFIEHCQNPVRAIVNMLRVLRNGGHILLTVPDKRFTFDKDRPITTNEHILEECLHGTESTRRGHFLEFARFCNGMETPDAIAKSADDMMASGYSIHYHVWDSEAFIRFLLFAKERFGLPFELALTCRNGEELIVVLRKTVP